METQANEERRCNIPCYEVNIVSVEISAANRDFLIQALKRLGLRHTVLANGAISVATPQGNIVIHKDRADLSRQAVSHLNDIKVAYSEITVEERAQQLGYTPIEETNEQGEKVYILRRYD